MTKSTATFISVIALIVMFLAAAGPLAAQSFDGPVPPGVPGELVYIPFPVEISVDGDLADWAELPTYTVDYGPRPASDPAENGSFTFAVAADADNFYITMQMPDQNIIAGKHGADFWNEDSMEFYINASGQLGTREYLSKVFQANINAADIGNSDPAALTITGVNSGDVRVQGFVFETEDGWGFEAAVPLSALLEPAHGAEIGFQAQINGATTKDRDVKLIWSKADKNDQSWNYPVLFGRAIFFELGREDVPQPSEVSAEATITPTPEPTAIPPQISVNQTGYFPAGKKIASVASDATDPIAWRLLDREGEVVLAGVTTIRGDDAASGDHLHVIDFSAYDKPGGGYHLATDELESAAFNISSGIYGKLRFDALAYFYHNRSGTPIEAKYVGEKYARPAGHITDSDVTCFKGKDADGHNWPGCDYTLDVAGGWYDAGDFGKYVVNGGISAWTLMNLYERFPEAYPDGSLDIPEGGNGVPDLLDEARWEMEFLLNMQAPAGQPLAGMAHHKIHDRTWEPLPMVPPTEVDNDNQHAHEGEGRYLYMPTTAATLNLAATAAQCARIWLDIDPPFSKRCWLAAEAAWDAAQANPGIYAGNTPGAGGGNYDDGVVSDEFYWAAAELFITTGDQKYLTYLLDSDRFGEAGSFDWGHTAALGTISLALTENDLPEEQMAPLQANIIAFADQFISIQNNEGYGVLIDGDYPWGSNGTVLNNMMLMAAAHDLSGDVQYLDAVRLSMDYIMGRNANNTSYVSGYGTYAMQHPHHRFWANDPANGYPPPPPGAVSGGPNTRPSDEAALDAGVTALPPAKRYVDDIGSYSTNEVTINWNAPLAWVAAYLDETSALAPTAVAEPAPTQSPAEIQPSQPSSEPEPEPSPDREATPDRSVPLLAVILLAAVLLAAIVFWFLPRRR